MRKLLISGILALASVPMWAEYNSISFNFSDGKVENFSSEGLLIKVDNGILNVSNSKGENLSVDASQLKSMQFNISEAGIATLPDLETAVKVYSAEGIYMGEYSNIDSARLALPEGVYVLKSDKGQIIKMIVKR